jgi:hypothetical protein
VPDPSRFPGRDESAAPFLCPPGHRPSRPLPGGNQPNEEMGHRWQQRPLVIDSRPDRVDDFLNPGSAGAPPASGLYDGHPATSGTPATAAGPGSRSVRGSGGGGARSAKVGGRGVRGGGGGCGSGDESDCGRRRKGKCQKCRKRRCCCRKPLRLPLAPLTAPTIAQRWTRPVICSYVRQMNQWRLNARAFLVWSKWFNKWGLFQTILTLTGVTGMIGVIGVDEDDFDWVGYVLGVMVLLVTGFDKWFGLSDSSDRYYWGAASLMSMNWNMRALLLRPFDLRPDPYEFQIAVSRRISDILAVANNSTIELSPDIFTPDPYD